uniref:LL11 n=1 Tax=Spodoptera exigua TaxID=7107 RepID=A0A3G1HH42_SPOEX|nr:LL11 [Spodoptera exigua]
MLKTQIFLTLVLWAGSAMCNRYLYYSDANGWFKVHKIPLTWQGAFLRCLYEDAILASPFDTELQKAMLAAKQEAGIDSPIFIGTKVMFNSADYLSIEGVHIEDMPVTVPNTNGRKPDDCMSLVREGEVAFTSCTQWLPYICYKENSTQLKYNSDCGTFDQEYHYNSETDSCYKLHKQARDWRQAYGICLAEGGHLVIIDDDKEADVVVKILQGKPRDLNWELSHAGFFDWNKDLLTFRTIHGEKMESVYHKWHLNQPDNKGINIFGGILENGELDEEWSTREAYFVCEKNPKNEVFELPEDQYENEVSTKK